MDALATLVDYGAPILPGIAVLGGCSVLLWGSRTVLLRVVVAILAFVLLRDAMTPAGFWTFGVAAGWVPWLRFTEDATVLLAFAAASMLLAVGWPLLDRDVGSLVVWGRLDARSVGLGVLAAAVVAGPWLAASIAIPLAARGGPVPSSLLPALLALALAGNLFEEVLFRGALQGLLARQVGPPRAAVVSGVLFAGCHAFLASTVTDVGWPLLAFTAHEGLVCAELRRRRGVAPAAITHGLAIFALAAGLV